MTPQEAWVHAKQCALVTVDEILSIYYMRFWEEVKQEIVNN